LETFRQEFNRLRDYTENGEYIYRRLIAEDLIIVNPAEVVANQLYELLEDTNLLNTGVSEGSEFYVSVPNLRNRNVRLLNGGSFTYDYKYGRTVGENQEYVKVVPFSRISIPADILSRLSQQVPEVFKMMASFNNDNYKTVYLKPEERIVTE
ncbi:MAG: hypothetical protein R2756_16310, partial [Bacteroidales bacterium]